MPANIPQSRESHAEVLKAVAENGNCGTQLLPVLQNLNARGIALDTDTASDVARAMNLPSKFVEGAVGFYKLLDRQAPPRKQARLCSGVACWLAGASDVITGCEGQFADDPECSIVRSSCLGLCEHAPAGLLNGKQAGHLSLTKVADHLSAETEASSSVARSIDLRNVRDGETRVLLEHSSVVDPDSMDSAVRAGVYDGLKAALQLKPGEIIDRITQSGLCGRGGAAFPTGQKWQTVASQHESPCVICNADESEPLMFKDRALIETNPHAVVAGIAIAAHTLSSGENYVYIRGEYEPQARRLERAIAEFNASDLCRNRWPDGLHIHVHRGAGAYICGEESALIESMEGQRGEPRLRPPYPAQHGYLGKPTLVNNVETFVYVSRILGQPTGFKANTRLVTLLGHVANSGLAEVAFDKTLRELLEIAGGLQGASKLKCILVGGASGVIVGPDALDRPLDYARSSNGIPLGSGGLLFCDESVSVRELVAELMRFFAFESCGKCTPCRVGTSLAHELLAGGEVNAESGERLRQIGQAMKTTSFCGLGTGAAAPLLSALEAFPHEFGID